jgi:Zn-dependent protease
VIVGLANYYVKKMTVNWYTRAMPVSLNLEDIFFVIVSLVVSITIHEAMHAFTARWLGDTTAEDAGRLTLNPLNHIDPFTTLLLPIISLVILGTPFLAAKPVPFRPDRVKYGEIGAALVGIAGPLSNLLLAVLAALLLRAFSLQVGANSAFSDLLTLFIWINVALFVFNMIPFPPLDGSRLLYAFSPEPLQELMSRIENMGMMAIIFFMLLFFEFLSPIFLNIDAAIFNFLLR